MHEVGYCEALLPVVDARAQGRAVGAIGIRAGVRHGLMGDVMQMAWQMVADGTPYADASTLLEASRMHATCGGCAWQYDTEDTLSECPSCGAVGARLAGGDEFGLAWVRYVDDGALVAGSGDQIAVDMSGHTHDDGDGHEHQHGGH